MPRLALRISWASCCVGFFFCLCIVAPKSSHFIPSCHPVRCLASLFSLKWFDKHSRRVNIQKNRADGHSLEVLGASPFFKLRFAIYMNFSGMFLWERAHSTGSVPFGWAEARGESRGWGETGETKRGTVRDELPGGSGALWQAAGLTGGEPLTVLPSRVHQEAQTDHILPETVFLKRSWTWEPTNDGGSQIMAVFYSSSVSYFNLSWVTASDKLVMSQKGWIDYPFFECSLISYY